MCGRRCTPINDVAAPSSAPMTDESVPARPVPRWLHWWAVLAVCATVVLLVLGQLVTTFRAGMADPIWPTEPWYLLNNYKEKRPGYLIEHSHRIAGYTVGGLVAVLALGMWATTPAKGARRAGLLAIIVLLAGYGQFHRAMIDQRDPMVRPVVPAGPVWAMVAALGMLLALGRSSRARGAGLRLLAVVALVAVMAQGLLGGLRVRLNDWFGTDFAIVHGVFAQVVFCLLVCVAVLTDRPPARELPVAARRLVNPLTAGLVALLFVQLVWGALVRHASTPLNQRLHILTAFLVVAVGVWLLRAVFTTDARKRVRGAGWVLGVFLVLQVALGV